MRYGMNLLLWTGMVGEEHFPLFEKLRQWGFDGVELPIIDADESILPRIRTCLNDLGLASTTATISTREENPIDENPAVRGAALDRIRRRIDWTVALGSELLMGPYHSAIGHFVGRGRNDDEWQWCVEYLRAAGEYAGQAGIKLSVEPLNRFECYFLNTAADGNRLVDEVNHPAVGYLYDTFHANIEEKDIRGSIVQNAAGINHFHVSENDRGVPGTGHVRWAESFQALKSTGYDGWLTLESFGRALPELAAATSIWRDLFSSAEDVAVQGLAFTKAQWEAA
jgi:D-psicose/D-tagatose/L-ribulose 3-epimerase